MGLTLTCLLCTTVSRATAWDPKTHRPIVQGKDQRLVYTPDSQGNRIPDFSYCGYMAAERPIPDVPVRVVVPLAQEGDATPRIQRALDYVAGLQADPNGIRGAVLLEPGLYHVSGSLSIHTSGVVLRGSGMGPGGTVILGEGQTRDTLILVAGQKDKTPGTPLRITDPYVPVNAMSVQVAVPHSIRPGDRVLIHRPCTQSWIQALGTDQFGGGSGYLGWKPGSRDLWWDRTVVAVEAGRIDLDAPLTTALDAAYGGGDISSTQWPGRISQVGIEALRCRSTYDKANPKGRGPSLDGRDTGMCL